ncbi:GNAT family N-acetyltransferase [Thalassospira tepidiphila]|uniref:GNAT family N-acetyltransferase n=1 Tax=Thalassospira tepidiphila TaxID=393657 RepID=UPI00292251A9|nr:alanine acetyltransferase [Thalassospira tepidiphila]
MFLRPLDPAADGAALHRIFGDPDCCTWLPDPAFADLEATITKLREWTIGFEATSWVICETPDGPALGRIALYNVGRDEDVWEAACMVTPAARGRNYAARGLHAAIRYLFENTTARRVFADIDPDNHASIRTFEKLGFTREGVLRGEWRTHIGIRDSVIFGLLRTDSLTDIPNPPELITA